jgi:hypothetical protein
MEAYQGVFARSFEITGSDNVLEATVELTGRIQNAGATYTPVNVETRVATFANAAWYYGNTLGTAGATIYIPTTTWSLKYTNNAVPKFEGSNTITRVDIDEPPTLEFSFSRYFDGSSGPLTFRDNVYTEDQERGYRLVLTSDSDDLIVGSTPYVLEFGIPKGKAMTTSRPYNAGELLIEEAAGEGLVHDATGIMCEPVLTTSNGFTY